MCKTVEVASAQVCQRPEKQRNTNTPSVPNSKLWTIHGKRYDLRPYVKKHPGGEHAILLGQGIDCTTLFETYHPFTERPHKVLKVYKYDDCPEPDVVDNVFDWTNTPFYSEIKAAARAYFSPRGDETDEEVQRNSKASWASWFRHGLGFSLLVWSFCQWLKDAPGSMWYFPSLYFVVGIDLMHNGSHYCMSRIPWINMLSAYVGSFHVQLHCWDLQHVIGHHGYTNVNGKDPDLYHFTHEGEPIPGFRVNREQKYFPKYGMKCLFWFAIVFHLVMNSAGLALLNLPFWLYTRKVEVVRMPESWVPAIKRDRALLLAACLVYICTRETILTGVFTLLASWGVHGTWFLIFTQISHVNEECMDGAEEYRKKHGLAKLEWARHQLLSGYDYSCDSYVMAIASINLNQQICHHMFPNIHPCHYPALRKIFIPIAAKYGIDYEARSSDTFLGAVTKALGWIVQLNDASNL
jgi:fatty acid desaturase